MSQHFDYLVIGAGNAGQTVAKAAAQAGHSVALTEGRAYGGTCPLRGCDPKLVLHAAAKAMQQVDRLQGKAFTSHPGFTWSDLMNWKRSFTEPIPASAREKMEEAGVTVFSEYASFVDARTMRFGDTEVTGDTIVLSVGQKPAPLDIPGKEHLLTSDDFLDMDDLPDEMVIIGGGYIGTETAHVCQALGCKITIVVSESVPLDKFDHDLADQLRQAMEDRGMRVLLNSKATAVEQQSDGSFRVTVEDEAGKETQLATKRVIHCAGRVPNIEELQLDKAGIKYSKQGIQVNDQLRTNLDHVYALGDCADSGLPLTPVVSYDGKLLTENLFEGKHRKLDYYPIPTVAFCMPAIASVGMTAKEAEENERELEIKHIDVTEWFHARYRNISTCGHKLIIDPQQDLLLGAHLLDPEAPELINMLYTIIRHRIKLSEVGHMIFAYPTSASVFKSVLAR